MALTTVRNLLERSLLLARAINKGEDPDSDEYSDALDALNSMLGSWQIERLMLPYVASAQYLTIPGQSDYSIGPAGDWNGVRPTKIINAWYERDNLTLPLKELEFSQYGDIPVKDVNSSDPWAFMYNASYPLAYFVLYPVPNREIKIVLSYGAVFGAVTLDTVISTLPDGYIQAISYGLAVLLANEYGKEPSKTVVQEAIRSKGVIKSSNIVALDAIIDPQHPGLRGTAWDWRTGA